MASSNNLMISQPIDSMINLYDTILQNIEKSNENLHNSDLKCDLNYFVNWCREISQGKTNYRNTTDAFHNMPTKIYASLYCLLDADIDGLQLLLNTVDYKVENLYTNWIISLYKKELMSKDLSSTIIKYIHSPVGTDLNISTFSLLIQSLTTKGTQDDRFKLITVINYIVPDAIDKSTENELLL